MIGGGHIGTTLSCYIKRAGPEKNVTLYTGHPEKFSESIRCHDLERELSYTVVLDRITADPALAVSEADMILVALPHFAVEGAFERIAPHIRPGVFIGVLPGGGGCEFFFERYFQDRAALFGAQRVPFTAKLVRYGAETNLKSWKPAVTLGALYREDLDEACRRMELCGLRTRKAPNYLSVALAPTNPLLHTGRVYEIFSGHDRAFEYAERCRFYAGWTDRTSEMLLSMDRELHKLLDAIPEIDTTAIRPLSEHYESYTVEALTKKINSIPTFQTVWAPMTASPGGKGGYIADTDSRMFSEDFPWGLALIRAYFSFFDMAAPAMDRLLQWYAGFMGLEWYVGGAFCGKDLADTGVPQRYGISSREELLSYYNRQSRRA